MTASAVHITAPTTTSPASATPASTANNIIINDDKEDKKDKYDKYDKDRDNREQQRQQHPTTPSQLAQHWYADQDGAEEAQAGEQADFRDPPETLITGPQYQIWI
jgi:hypothetical protein